MEHHFDVEFAAEHGFAAAVIYRHFQFWIAHNKANKQNQRNGRTWTFNSVKAFRELFPYLKSWDIRKAVKHLLKCELLIKDHFGKGFDRTLWYAFGDEKTALESIPVHLRNTQMDLAPAANGFVKGRKCILGTDKEPVVEPDNTDASQKRLSEQKRAVELLIKFGVEPVTAGKLVHIDLHPLTSIENAIQNGIAKQKYERGFVLQPGYIVETLNSARAEGKVVSPTKYSRRIKDLINQTAKKLKSPARSLSPADFKRRQAAYTTQLKASA